MSDTESGSVEVRELLEMVLKEPVDSDTNDTTNNLSPSKEKVIISELPNHSIHSMDIQPEIPIITNTSAVELQQRQVPVVAEHTHNHVTPAEPDLRAIESNALKLIAQYGSDSDSEYSESSGEVVAIDDIEVVAIDDIEVVSVDDNVDAVLKKTLATGNYRVVSSDSEDESESSDDSDVEVISIQNEIITLDDDDVEDSDQKSRGPIRVEGEFTIDSLPPIEDLKISVPEDECVVLGKILSIVDQLVVVDSLPGSRPIDIDSVLFLDRGTKPLGHVFDVLGNISSPMYCVRFNSNKQIQEKGITVGSLVYVAPRTEHTSFVIVSELMKQKGCDASWKNDIEPMNAQDFSDDEEERKARRMRRGRNNSINENESVDSTAQSSTPTQNGNNQRNSHNRDPRAAPRRRRGNFNRGPPAQNSNYGHAQNRNYGHAQNRSYGPPVQHSWHQNLSQPNWNSPMRNNGPAGQFPQSLLLPPPPPPPSSNSRW